jgi:hypothetical protein
MTAIITGTGILIGSASVGTVMSTCTTTGINQDRGDGDTQMPHVSTSRCGWASPQ